MWTLNCSGQWKSFQLRLRWRYNLWPSQMGKGNLCKHTHSHAYFTFFKTSQLYYSADWISRVWSCSPVLRIFLMTEATCPFSMELSNLTMQTKQEHRTSRERARRMRPTARSGRFTSTNRWSPAETHTQTWR